MTTQYLLASEVRDSSNTSGGAAPPVTAMGWMIEKNHRAKSEHGAWPPDYSSR